MKALRVEKLIEMGVPLSPPVRAGLDSHRDEDFGPFPTLILIFWIKTPLSPSLHPQAATSSWFFFERKESCHQHQQQQLPLLLLHSHFSMNLQTFLKCKAPLSTFPTAAFPFAMANTFHKPSPNIWFSAEFSTREMFLPAKKAAFWTYHRLAGFFFLRTENIDLLNKY